jgi:hypothetical protein
MNSTGFSRGAIEMDNRESSDMIMLNRDINRIRGQHPNLQELITGGYWGSVLTSQTFLTRNSPTGEPHEYHMYKRLADEICRKIVVLQKDPFSTVQGLRDRIQMWYNDQEDSLSIELVKELFVHSIQTNADFAVFKNKSKLAIQDFITKTLNNQTILNTLPLDAMDEFRPEDFLLFNHMKACRFMPLFRLAFEIQGRIMIDDNMVDRREAFRQGIRDNTGDYETDLGASFSTVLQSLHQRIKRLEMNPQHQTLP